MKIERLDRFKRKLRMLSPATKAEIAIAIQKSADEITDLQKRLAPERTGKLKGSIGNRPVEGTENLAVELHAGGAATTKPVRNGASATYDYALADEFGTTETTAQPYFYPAYRLGKKRAKARIARAATSAAKKVARS